MIDRYTKVVLTIIALALIAIAVRDLPAVTKADAQVDGPIHVVIDEVSRSAFRFVVVPVRNAD